MKAERWLCQDCGKEWSQGSDMGYLRVIRPDVIDPQTRQPESKAWTPNDGCPSCRSDTIGLVRYDAAFPGGDIPRDRLASLECIPYRRSA